MAKQYLTVNGQLVMHNGKLIQVPDPDSINDLLDEQDGYATQSEEMANEIEELIVNGVIDGTPKDVYANLSALQTAFPSGASGVYLTSDNGHWHYWNGSAWIDGGVYHSSEDVKQIKSDLVKLEKITDNGIIKLEYLAPFSKSTIDVNGNNVAYANRVSSTEIIKTNIDLSLSIDSNFNVAIHCYDDNGSHLSDSGWVTSNYTIAKNSNFKIVIAKRNEEEADIDLYLSKVEIKTAIKTIVDSTKNRVDEIDNTIDNGLFITSCPALTIARYKATHKGTANIGDIYSINFESGYNMAITIASDKEFSNILYDSGWKTSSLEYKNTYDGYFMISGKRSDYKDLTNDDLDNFHYSIKKIVSHELDNLKNETNESFNELNNDVNNIKFNSSSLFNVFNNHPFYHHMNQESATPFIPAQSIFDLYYAKSLGFDMIEVNPHKCSDGVFICKHGISGKLGNGITSIDGVDYSETLITEVTSAWIRENISYDSCMNKYKGKIPTLDEFCLECKKLSMKIKIATLDAVDVARKYLPDDMILSTQSIRGDFRGTIEYVWESTQSIDDCISRCKAIGTPLNIVIMAGEFSSHTDDEIKELCYKAHCNGFTVGMVYPTQSDIIRALSLGVDVIGSTINCINHFEVGNDLNICRLDDSLIVKDSDVTYDSTNETLTIPANSKVQISNTKQFNVSMISMRIRFKGKIDIVNANNSNEENLYNIESDGSNYVNYSIAIEKPNSSMMEYFVSITAKDNTTIEDLKFSSSIIN